MTPTPIAQVWTLSGHVTAAAGGDLSGGAVAILDGADAGKSTITNTAGLYSFSNLQAGGFSVRVSAPGYTTVTRGVPLTSNVTADFSLVHIPLAALTFGGGLIYVTHPDGAYLEGTGTNSGDGCASNVVGTSTVSDSAANVIGTFTWSLVPSLIVRSGASFTYDFGPVNVADLTAKLGASGTYFTTGTFTSATCP